MRRDRNLPEAEGRPRGGPPAEPRTLPGPGAARTPAGGASRKILGEKLTPPPASWRNDPRWPPRCPRLWGGDETVILPGHVPPHSTLGPDTTVRLGGRPGRDGASRSGRSTQRGPHAAGPSGDQHRDTQGPREAPGHSCSGKGSRRARGRWTAARRAALCGVGTLGQVWRPSRSVLSTQHPAPSTQRRGR